MCYICKLLDKSFPSPKELARAYFEAYKLIDPSHDEAIERKIDAKLEEISPEPDFKDAYINAFNDEVKQIAIETNPKLN